MSSETTMTMKRKKTSSEKSPDQPTVNADHRKRRRNRTTQSCLNCHTSKRMCDRKRPACARCTQLGLTGLCVYEVDDPNQRPDSQDESSRLLKRVAELEGVIRELKNKPNPRWVSSGGEQTYSPKVVTHLPSPSSSTPESPSQESAVAVSCPPRVAASPLSSPSPSSDSSLHMMINDDPSASGPSYNKELGSFFTLDSNLLGFEGSAHQQMDKPSYCAVPSCKCVLDASNYQMMLELSLRLRKAAGILAQSPLHQAGAYCLLNQKLAELDVLTTNTLTSVDSPHLNMAFGGMYQTFNSTTNLPTSLPATLYTSSDSSYRLDQWLTTTAAKDSENDSFMSWDPPRRP